MTEQTPPADTSSNPSAPEPDESQETETDAVDPATTDAPAAPISILKVAVTEKKA